MSLLGQTLSNTSEISEKGSIDLLNVGYHEISFVLHIVDEAPKTVLVATNW